MKAGDLQPTGEEKAEAFVGRVAFASRDGETVDEHFGSARAFVLFDLGCDLPVLVKNKKFQTESRDGNEDKLVAKLEFLRQAKVDFLVCAQIGPSAVRLLLSQATTPIVVTERPTIQAIIERLAAGHSLTGTSTKQRPCATRSEKEARLRALLKAEWEPS